MCERARPDLTRDRRLVHFFSRILVLPRGKKNGESAQDSYLRLNNGEGKAVHLKHHRWENTRGRTGIYNLTENEIPRIIIIIIYNRPQEKKKELLCSSVSICMDRRMANGKKPLFHHPNARSLQRDKKGKRRTEYYALNTCKEA